jgi:hypothetical protein
LSWPSGFGPERWSAPLTAGDRRADHIHLGGRDRIRDVRLPAQARDLVYRVAREDLVPHRQFERSQLFVELVAPGDADLTQRETSPRWARQLTVTNLAHVARAAQLPA